MPETRAEQKARAREAERRREAAGLLRVAESVCGYAARQLCDGLAPEEAREAAVEAAGELAVLATRLRTLARLRPAERRSLARLMAGAGTPRTEIARRLGVSYMTVKKYLDGLPPQTARLLWLHRERQRRYRERQGRAGCESCVLQCVGVCPQEQP